VESYLRPYQALDTRIYTQEGIDSSGKPIIKSRTILEEVHRFAHQASLIAQEEEFDIIHAHDWTSYLAGVAAKIASGKPLILHVHATSFDQAASENVDPNIFKIEKEAFAAADKIVAVSSWTRNIVIDKHGADPHKVEVVHNGCDTHEPERLPPTLAGLKAEGKKVVLYHGRITIQKGVDYFVRAARRVVDVDPNVVFVISGSGDMTTQIINQVGAIGLSKHVIFAGALWETERDRMYQSADLVVMPSVSEPFGLVPLEALQHGTPSLITHQSGVGEVLTHVLKVDFWDVDEMANKILSALRYPVMRQQIVNEGKRDLHRLSWREAAQKVYHLYKSLLQYITT
jgi:glycosyltransferase involved in cell wall biosynthesis